MYIATSDSLLSLPSGSSSFTSTKLTHPSANSVAVSSSGDQVAVGFEDGKVQIFASSSLAQAKQTLEKNRSTVTSLSFTPSGDLLAVGDSTGKILLYTTSTGELKNNQWVFHTSRITSLAWTLDGKYLVSASLDTSVYIWNLEKPLKRIVGKNVHANGVQFVQWIDDSTKEEGKEAKVVSAGADGAFRVVSAFLAIRFETAADKYILSSFEPLVLSGSPSKHKVKAGTKSEDWRSLRKSNSFRVVSQVSG